MQLVINSNKFRKVIAKQRVRINTQIRASKVRVVDPGGKHGIYTLEEALALAEGYDLDLVEISPNAEPPVCKIIDYGKYKYEQQKKDKEARKKTQTVSLKEIRFRPRTDTHDFEFKVKHARQFLSDGNMVKAWVQFRGRDILYKDHGAQLLKRFIQALEEVGKVDQGPRMEGRRMTLIMSPQKKKK
ncbi:MAG: translation initiation factor IF-3 [Bacteroidota bacterium]